VSIESQPHIANRAPPPGGRTRICLNMIAKDEAKLLNETLSAAAPHLSSWMVCDTGSTDGTPELATAVLSGAHGVPGVVERHAWKDFAHNRNECLQAGYRVMGSTCDYWLLLDADQVLVAENGTNLATLGIRADAYWLEERCHGTHYSNLRLVHTSLPWVYKGAVHEYIWVAEGPKPVAGTLPTSVYTLHDTEGGRSFEADVELLKAAIARDPSDSRSYFYLANTYQAMHDFDRAIVAYIERIILGSWHEEVYYSALNIGMALEEMFKTNHTVTEETIAELDKWVPLNSTTPDALDVLVAYEAASKVLPYRQEAKYFLARFLRIYFKDYKLCYGFAADAHASGPHKVTALFTQHRILEYGVDDEICICAYYADQSDKGMQACERLETKLRGVPNMENDSYLQELLLHTRKNKAAYGAQMLQGVTGVTMKAF
jgi:tetratricopeptide (TPR) repeat protein